MQTSKVQGVVVDCTTPVRIESCGRAATRAAAAGMRRADFIIGMLLGEACRLDAASGVARVVNAKLGGGYSSRLLASALLYPAVAVYISLNRSATSTPFCDSTAGSRHAEPSSWL